MCRSIVVLRGEAPATEDEIRAAALQYVRKVSGSRAPAAANREAFARAVDEVAAATARLLGEWVSPPGAKPPAMVPSRVVARQKAQAAGRYGA
ncbi:MAG TPA: DUF2277 domain-containing protein [Acidimicrobiales bacterium]|nr:DUF2277 domain-containing protein [Acidimicrobiales bacterium]